MEAIILAGGLGTRLASRLDGIPKPMAPVAGRPFLEILLRQLERAGCARVVLSVGYLHQVIEDRFGAAFGAMRLDYAVEQAALGTGGAIRNALGLVREDTALVLNGDTFLDADYAAMMRFHRGAGARLTIAVTRQPDVARYGGVELSGARVVSFQEKGRAGEGKIEGWINAGAYGIDSNLEWPPGLEGKFSFEKEFLAPRIAELKPAAFAVNGFFLDIGVPEDLDRAQMALAGY